MIILIFYQFIFASIYINFLSLMSNIIFTIPTGEEPFAISDDEDDKTTQMLEQKSEQKIDDKTEQKTVCAFCNSLTKYGSCPHGHDGNKCKHCGSFLKYGSCPHGHDGRKCVKCNFLLRFGKCYIC